MACTQLTVQAPLPQINNIQFGFADLVRLNEYINPCSVPYNAVKDSDVAIRVQFEAADFSLLGTQVKFDVSYVDPAGQVVTGSITGAFYGPGFKVFDINMNRGKYQPGEYSSLRVTVTKV